MLRRDGLLVSCPASWHLLPECYPGEDTGISALKLRSAYCSTALVPRDASFLAASRLQLIVPCHSLWGTSHYGTASLPRAAKWTAALPAPRFRAARRIRRSFASTSGQFGDALRPMGFCCRGRAWAPTAAALTWWPPGAAAAGGPAPRGHHAVHAGALRRRLPGGAAERDGAAAAAGRALPRRRAPPHPPRRSRRPDRPVQKRLRRAAATREALVRPGKSLCHGGSGRCRGLLPRTSDRLPLNPAAIGLLTGKRSAASIMAHPDPPSPQGAHVV